MTLGREAFIQKKVETHKHKNPNILLQIFGLPFRILAAVLPLGGSERSSAPDPEPFTLAIPGLQRGSLLQYCYRDSTKVKTQELYSLDSKVPVGHSRLEFVFHKVVEPAFNAPFAWTCRRQAG